MTSHSLPWNSTYASDKKVWGDKPSELAVYAYNYLKQSSQYKDKKDIYILDLGCGYGRDAIFLAQNLPCHILGLDSSNKAIEMAQESITKEIDRRVEFLCYDFTTVKDKYDVILTSNLYHLLKTDERAKLRNTVRRCLKVGGLLFLSSLSVHDPQHYGKGQPVENEENSFVDKVYLHLSTRKELEEDFSFLNISALFEREFHEYRSTNNHHHVNWILLGSLK